MRIIAFAGNKGVGKDTAGEVFIKAGWKKASFAWPLKRMLHVLMQERGCENPKAYTDGDRKEQPTPYLMGLSAREAMQKLGEEWGRKLINPELWIDTFKVSMANPYAARTNFVLTDVRYPNEVAALKELGAKVYRIVRPSIRSDTSHMSEALVSSLDVDEEIINDCLSPTAFKNFIAAMFDTELNPPERVDFGSGPGYRM